MPYNFTKKNHRKDIKESLKVAAVGAAGLCVLSLDLNYWLSSGGGIALVCASGAATLGGIGLVAYEAKQYKNYKETLQKKKMTTKEFANILVNEFTR